MISSGGREKQEQKKKRAFLDECLLLNDQLDIRDQERLAPRLSLEIKIVAGLQTCPKRHEETSWNDLTLVWR